MKSKTNCKLKLNMEQTNEKLDKVMKQLRKLKALYEGATKINSEGEANNAARAIQRLLLQYNLTMEEVDGAEEKSKETVMHEKVSGYTYKSIGGEWENRLVYVICKWNFCRCFIYGSSYKVLLIVGKKENMEMVKWLRSFLSEHFVTFSKERFKEYKKTSEYAMRPISLDKYQRSYLMGCAAGLDAKLQEEHEKEKKDVELSTKITALVVRNDQAVSEYVDNMFGKTGKRSRKERFDGARQSGFTDGRNTSINKPISGGRSQASSVKLLG